MGDKSARKESGKTSAASTLKEKRAAKAVKKASKDRSENTDAVTKARSRG